MARSLVERLAELTDPRDRRGRQYPMVGLLTLCLVAVLAGHTGPEAIAQFGRLRQKRLGHALGFRNGNMPCANTIAALLRGLDADHLDRIIAAWLTDRHGGWEHIALDGKRLCGSRDGEVPGTHLLAAYAPQASAVIAQMTVCQQRFQIGPLSRPGPGQRRVEQATFFRSKFPQHQVKGIWDEKML
jgi:hypothetical protein